MLANLWDVTDKDIDKLSMSCMRAVFDSADAAGSGCGVDDGRSSGGCGGSVKGSVKEGEKDDMGVSMSVAGALKQSRDVCKLPYAVGSAPVMYGLPVRTAAE